MIDRIHYTWGSCSTKQSLASSKDLERAEWSGDSIDPAILASAYAERVMDFDGEFGDPDWATPIEVDVIEIEAEDQQRKITIYNRGLLLMSTNSEGVRRLHRFCCVLRDRAK